MNIEQAVVEKLKTLSIEKQQEVLDFVEFLQAKVRKQEFKLFDETPTSVREVAKEFAGCLDGGPTDLSINKKYLEELGTA
jgi:hypothetical protein